MPLSYHIAKPSRAEPSRAEPSRAEPSRAEPSRAGAGADAWLQSIRIQWLPNRL
jgi:hypothetical protein